MISDKKKKTPYPDPRAATDMNQSGVVIEIQGVLGKLKLTSADPARDGQKVLLSKNRTYINGHKIISIKTGSVISSSSISRVEMSNASWSRSS